jgi:DNA-binding LacI/PurR family transcriptional regulator
LVYNVTVPKRFGWVGSTVTVTLKDIAQQVNRSITTVSRALHDCEDVSPETREMVKRTAEQMGYAPNVAAQRLQKQRTEAIGLILPSYGPRLSDPFFGDVLAGVADEIARAGFDLLINVAHSPADEMEVYRQRVSGRRVDSLLVVRPRCHDRRIQFLLERRMPFVVNGRVLESWDFPYVDVDYRHGMRALVHHLNALGHRRVAFATGSPDLTFVHYQIEGFRQAMVECGMEADEDLIVEGELTQRGGYNAGQILLSQNKSPSAIAASNDLMALGVMSAVQDQGLEVGHGVAVAGFDDIPMAETSHPTLTTVRQPAYHLGKTLGQMLMVTALGEAPVRPHVLIEPSLIIRQSTNLDLWL